MGQAKQYGISASDLLQRVCQPSCRVTIGEDEDLLLDGPATLRAGWHFPGRVAQPHSCTFGSFARTLHAIPPGLAGLPCAVIAPSVPWVAVVGSAVLLCWLGVWYCCKDGEILKCLVSFDWYWPAFWVAGLLKLRDSLKISDLERSEVWVVRGLSCDWLLGKEGKRTCCLKFPDSFLANSETGNLG